MKTALLASLLAFVVVPNRSTAASPPEQLATAEPVGVHDADTVLALRELGRAQLRVEAAAELTALALQAVAAASDLQVPKRHSLAGWLDECKRMRQAVRAIATGDAAALEGLRKRHAALQQAFSHWQLGAHNHTVAVEELLQHISSANEAEDRAQVGVDGARRALRSLLALHRRAVAGYKRIDGVLREGESELQTLTRRVAREQQRCVRLTGDQGMAQHSGGTCQHAVDNAAAELRAAEVELAAVQSKLEAALELEQQRRMAFDHGQRLLASTEEAAERVRADRAQVTELSAGRTMNRLLRGRERLSVEQSSLQNELNGVLELISAQEPLIGSAAAQAPAEGDLPASSTTTVLPAMGSAHAVRATHAAGAVQVEQHLSVLVETQAELPENTAAVTRRVPPAQVLSKRDYLRAAKPAGELLKGAVAGGFADRALLKTPGLLKAVRALEPRFGELDVAFSGRNRVFWLADGRQILLLNVCRSSHCGKRAHVIAYDQMKEQAALLRSQRGKLELLGAPDHDLRGLLLWYYGQRQRQLSRATVASR